MRALLLAAAWALLSAAYRWGVLTMVGVVCGRAGTGYHLAAFGAVLVVWVAGSVFATIVWRARTGAQLCTLPDAAPQAAFGTS